MPSCSAALQPASRSVPASAAAADTARARPARMMASPTPETLHPTAGLQARHQHAVVQQETFYFIRHAAGSRQGPWLPCRQAA
jgi:hypothetical protein